MYFNLFLSIKKSVFFKQNLLCKLSKNAYHSDPIDLLRRLISLQSDLMEK